MPIHGYPGNIITANPTEPSQTSASGVWTTEQQLQYQNAGKWPPPYYLISRSLRFNSADSAYLNRTNGSPTSATTWTLSFWHKRSSGLGTQQNIMGAGQSSGTNYSAILFTSANQFEFNELASGVNLQLTPTQVFRDVSAWYHIIIAVDTTQATASNRIKLYVNGSQITAFTNATYPSQNYATYFNTNAYIKAIGNIWYNGGPGGYYLNGYLTEVNFIDGQALTPSSFGENNPDTGVWEPIKYTGTYGTNGFYLNFSDNSGTTATTLGKDSSGNGNNWTPNNFSVTAGVGNDSLVDTPTSYGSDTGVGGEVRGNYCTWNGVSIGTDATLANGNLDISYGSGLTRNSTMGTFGMSSGKWYWEVTITASSASPTNAGIGISNNPSSSSVANYPGFTSTSWGYVGDGNKYNNSSPSAYGATYTTNDVISFAFDVDAGSITAYKNGVSQGVMFSGLAANTYYPAIGDGGGASTFTAAANFGQRPFAYTAPSGFKALCTQNLPTPTIGATSTTTANKYMDATLYAGNNTTNAITNSGSMAPDFVWIKNRTGAFAHYLSDTVRGVYQVLFSNLTNAEYNGTSNSDGVSSFNSNGFTVLAGTNKDNYNSTGNNYVAWQWNAGGSNATNTSGTITSTVRASTTAGFSIVTYTGNGIAGATVGHGLGVAPSMIIVKARSNTSSWNSYHISLGNTGGIDLNSTGAFSVTSNYWNNTSPTSSVFSLGAFVNNNGFTFVAYCFAAVAGYSAFGSYTGNGSTDGPFVFTGFRPRYIMRKRTDTTAYWVVFDTARNTYNVVGEDLYPNDSLAGSNDFTMDILSNGFKIRGSGTNINANGGTYIYAAFAESPFKYALAR